MALIDKIGRELQARYSSQEIDAFLAEFKIEPPGAVNSNSKWVYSKAALTGIPDDVVLRYIAHFFAGLPGQQGRSHLTSSQEIICGHQTDMH